MCLQSKYQNKKPLEIINGVLLWGNPEPLYLQPSQVKKLQIFFRRNIPSQPFSYLGEEFKSGKNVRNGQARKGGYAF